MKKYLFIILVVLQSCATDNTTSQTLVSNTPYQPAITNPGTVYNEPSEIMNEQMHMQEVSGHMGGGGAGARGR